MSMYIDYRSYINCKLNPKDNNINSQRITNMLDNAKVKSILTDKNVSYVTVQYEVKDKKHDITQLYSQTLVIDHKTIIKDSRGKRRSIKDLKENIVLNARISSKPKKCLPPQSKAFQIDIIK